jgi:hypothetical protein
MVRIEQGQLLMTVHGVDRVVDVQRHRGRWTGVAGAVGKTDCPRRVFAERLEPAVSTAFSRRTERLEGIVHHLGLALGGRPGQSFARRLIIAVSKDTLLRVVRRRTAEPTSAPKVVGIDDWAWSGVIATGRSSAIWNNGGSSTSCPTGRPRPSLNGLPSTHPSPSSPATAGLGLCRRRSRADLKLCKSPTAGI